MGNRSMQYHRLSRKDLRDAFITTFKPHKQIHALWEAGSAAFGRDDEWSDIDLQLLVDDNSVENTFDALETFINKLGGYSMKFRIPEPAWHGQSQVFYILKRASPYLYLDICIIKKSAKDKFLQHAIHGKPIVHFDKGHFISDDPPDINQFADKIITRLNMIKNNFELNRILVLKELNRGRLLEAHGFYLSAIIRPLVEVLRIKHSPYHYNFHVAYITFDLPVRDVKMLKELILVKDASDMRTKLDFASNWLKHTIAGLTITGVKKNLKKQAYC